MADSSEETVSMEYVSVANEAELENFLESPDLLSKLPEEMKKKINIEKVHKMLTEESSLSFLVTGRTGTGKSTFINGLMGMKVGDEEFAEEGDGLDSFTLKLHQYKKRKGRINVSVWDSRGLLDGKADENESLKEMVDKCSEVELKLLCISMDQQRFVRGDDNPDVCAMKKLTQEFGKDFWRNVFVVLTFANEVDLQAKDFKRVIEYFKQEIHGVLVGDIGISQDIVKFVKVVPAGNYEDWQLPDREFWLSDLWFEVMDALPTPEAQGAFLTLNIARIKTAPQVSDKDFKFTPLHIQPIIFQPKKMPIRWTTALQTLGYGLAGAGSGGVIGLSTLAAGGAPAAIGVPVGLVIGFFIGLALGAHKVEMESTERKKNKDQ